MFLTCFTVNVLQGLFFCTRNLQFFSAAVVGGVPLFQAETSLSAPEIVLIPNANEIYKLTMQSVRDCLESTKVCWQSLTLFRFPMDLLSYVSDTFIQ